MLHTIREIGIFMVAAQAVVHFSPGRQYEKYIKSISSVIILLLFLRPLFTLAGGVWEEPGELLKRMEEEIEIPAFPAAVKKEDIEDALLQQAQKEIVTTLDQTLAAKDYTAKSVSLRIAGDKDAAGEDEAPVVEVVIGKREAENRIIVEPVTVGEAGMEETEEALMSCRRECAAALGIPEENVEVRWDGRR